MTPEQRERMWGGIIVLVASLAALVWITAIAPSELPWSVGIIAVVAGVTVARAFGRR